MALPENFETVVPDQLGELAELLVGDKILVAREGAPLMSADAQSVVSFLEDEGVGAGNAAAAAASAAVAGAAKVDAEEAKDLAISAADKLQPQPGATGLVITDAAGNVLMEITPGGLKHPTVTEMLSKLSDLEPARVGFATQPGQSEFVIGDGAGYILMRVTAAALIHPQITQMVADLADVGVAKAAVGKQPGLSSTVITDAAGHLLAEITSDQFKHPVIDRVRAELDGLLTADRAAAVAAITDMVHIMIDGQSTSQGGFSAPALSTAGLSYAKKFAGGVAAHLGAGGAGVVYASLNPLAEVASETPASGLAKMIEQLLIAEDALDLTARGQQLLLSCPGQGGKNLGELSNTPYVTNLRDQVAYGLTRAAALSKTYFPQALSWIHGESDTGQGVSRTIYREGVRALRSNAEAWAATTTGVPRPVPMFVSQVACHVHHAKPPNIALAQLDLAGDEMIAFVCPQYFLPYLDPVGDGEHFSNVGSMVLGAYHGLAIKRWLWDGVKPTHLRPLRPYRQGVYVIAPYADAVGALVLDTATIANPGGYGFSLVDAAGADLAISAVALTRGGVRITATAPVPAGARLRYGWNAPATGNVNCGVGNLRDSQGVTVIFDPAGVAWPMHNWAPISEQEIA